MLLVEDTPARAFLSHYAKTLPKPRGIVIASAHFGTTRPAVVGDAQPGMIYDFGGLPQLRRLVYRAPGDPIAAIKIAGLLEAAGFAPAIVKDHGYDHGTWVPLMLLYPEADVPVIQLAVQPYLGPAHHVAVGRALATLKDEGFLVIGSGSATHNLAEFYSGAHDPDQPALQWVSEFTDWVHDRIAEGSLDELVHYRELAPHAEHNHPTEEHFLPLFVALGASHDGVKGKRIHASTRNGVLAMDTYAFG
jgi:4,5-DOPA dioxygenase extradiol